MISRYVEVEAADLDKLLRVVRIRPACAALGIHPAP
ncbi:hypothetical protein FHR32_008187 [Streptosporangium album]|uniref:Uncharacterized protein n=1 Tax=Streptosporangium album TaxID=47479 RepID=A0A7W7WE47_9ACTN|nr:hypothetical protein [Streptosporangium album]